MIIIKFLIILLVLITVHEFGHFIVAKIFNVYVSEFALGFGPKVFSKKGKETEFSIRLLPLGGYAAMVGEDGEIEDEELKNLPFERTLKGVNRFKQFLIMFAGSFMNILLAFVVFMGIGITYNQPNPDPIIDVPTSSAAYDGGVRTNDRAIKIVQDDKTTQVKSYSSLIIFEYTNKEGKPFDLYVERDGKELKYTIKPEYSKKDDMYLAGYTATVLKKADNPVDAFKNGFAITKENTQNIFTSLKMLFTGKAGVKDLSGPVGIVSITSDIDKEQGFIGLVNFTAILSLNLAIFNLLPIPALDGGRILLLIIEAVTRKKISPELESKIIGISFILLMVLIVFVTGNDILKLFK
ncbi:MAG: M50 family metallopeptidase [Erysipelotrichales bacterium]